MTIDVNATSLFMLATSWIILIFARWDFFWRSLRLIADSGRT
jgi:hypothetical protein